MEWEAFHMFSIPSPGTFDPVDTGTWAWEPLAEVPCVVTPLNFYLLIINSGKGEDSCLESFVQREKHTRPKAVFLRCFAITNSSEKGQQEWERAMPSGQGSGFACFVTIFVGLSPLTPHSCTPVTSLHPSSTANSPLLPPVSLTLDSLTIQAFNLCSVLTLF